MILKRWSSPNASCKFLAFISSWQNIFYLYILLSISTKNIKYLFLSLEVYLPSKIFILNMSCSFYPLKWTCSLFESMMSIYDLKGLNVKLSQWRSGRRTTPSSRMSTLCVRPRWSNGWRMLRKQSPGSWLTKFTPQRSSNGSVTISMWVFYYHTSD